MALFLAACHTAVSSYQRISACGRKASLGTREVRGVAATYAHVVIKQQGKIIKEIDVPPVLLLSVI